MKLWNACVGLGLAKICMMHGDFEKWGCIVGPSFHNQRCFLACFQWSLNNHVPDSLAPSPSKTIWDVSNGLPLVLEVTDQINSEVFKVLLMEEPCTTWYVWNPKHNGIIIISTGAGFLPSTLWMNILASKKSSTSSNLHPKPSYFVKLKSCRMPVLGTGLVHWAQHRNESEDTMPGFVGSSTHQWSENNGAPGWAPDPAA